MGLPRPLFNLFSSFQTNITISTTNVKNVHQVYGAVIRTHDLEHESPHLTTRPGLSPHFIVCAPFPDELSKEFLCCLVAAVEDNI